MRRSDREIKDRAELLDVISRCDVCRLALNDEEGYPYILPLNFGEKDVDGQLTLYFHGAMEGKKYELMEKDPRASFEMDCSHELFMNDEKMGCTMKYERKKKQKRWPFSCDTIIRRISLLDGRLRQKRRYFVSL